LLYLKTQAQRKFVQILTVKVTLVHNLAITTVRHSNGLSYLAFIRHNVDTVIFAALNMLVCNISSTVDLTACAESHFHQTPCM